MGIYKNAAGIELPDSSPSGVPASADDMLICSAPLFVVGLT